MRKLGTPETIFGREFMEPLSMGSKPNRFPRLKEGHELVCDVIRAPGVDSLNYTLVVENADDMKSLTDAYSRGMIIQLNWYSAPDPGFITFLSLDNSDTSEQSSPSMK